MGWGGGKLRTWGILDDQQEALNFTLSLIKVLELEIWWHQCPKRITLVPVCRTRLRHNTPLFSEATKKQDCRVCDSPDYRVESECLSLEGGLEQVSVDPTRP